MSVSISALISFFVAFGICVISIPFIKIVSFRLGVIAYPREDRWNRKPTPILGGVSIFMGFIIAVLITLGIRHDYQHFQWGILVGPVIVFILGLYDDFRPVSPQAKLIGQIVAAASVILQGYGTDFFSPRIENQIIADLPNILLTFIWLVGITNAINLLDNMDGLAGGISLITSLFLSYFFWSSGDIGILILPLALAGAILGFLLYNFPPASIFMGDSGSLFLGFSLALLSIARQPQASNVFAVMGVPILLFLLPIMDTVLVTLTRVMRGDSPVQGGRDHTSHRLIAFGLNERQVLFVLYFVAILSGVLAATFESIRYWFSLVLLPILVITLALLTAYLGRIKVISNAPAQHTDKAITRIVLDLTLRRRLLEVVLDFFLIGIAYYLAFLTYFGSGMNIARLSIYLQTLPLALGGGFLSFFALGIYRGVWRYVGLEDLMRYFAAAFGAFILLAAALYSIGSIGFIILENDYSPSIPIFFGIYMFLGLAASRVSFKLLDLYAARRSNDNQVRVLIIGASDAGEMALRWIMMNPRFDYHPVGFLDSDPYMYGRRIHGVRVLGGFDKLEVILEKFQVAGVILAGEETDTQEIRELRIVCKEWGCWVRSLPLGFDLLD